MIELRPYQSDIANRANETLRELGLVYLALEVRTGKTLISLDVAMQYLGGDLDSNILFVTKKKAIPDIEQQAADFGVPITAINYESLHKLDQSIVWDVVIGDEFHSISSYPKPSKRYIDLKKLLDICGCPLICLSGTPSPESYSQLYHQFAVSKKYSPFKEYTNFYKWAKDYVDVYQQWINGRQLNKYDRARKDKIDAILKPYFYTYTQKEAGFEQKVTEQILYVKMKPITHDLIKRIQRDKMVQGKNDVILADTAVKEMQKVHQLSSGTCLFEPRPPIEQEDGSYIEQKPKYQIFDTSKAGYIKERFKGKKIAIFYKFRAELELLINTFPNYTLSPSIFNDSPDKTFIGQVQSCREGINLSSADCLIYYNIEFSALSYIQGRDRMTSKTRTKDNEVYFIFAKGGIEDRIFEAVKNKEDYTLSYYKRDYND